VADRLVEAFAGDLAPADTEADVREIARGPYGARLVQLCSARAFDREGLRMEHCLRSTLHYFDESKRGDIAILSLRTAADIPQVTVEINRRETRPVNGLIAQAQGPRNGAFPPTAPVVWLRTQLERIGAVGDDALDRRWAARFERPSTPHAAALHRADEALARAFDPILHGAEATEAALTALLQTGDKPLHAWRTQQRPTLCRTYGAYGWSNSHRVDALCLSVAIYEGTPVLRLSLSNEGGLHTEFTAATWSGLDAQLHAYVTPNLIPESPLLGPDEDPRLDAVRPFPRLTSS
jgi:hypothetical protein